MLEVTSDPVLLAGDGRSYELKDILKCFKKLREEGKL